MTHKASCKDLSASSNINLFEPLIMMEQVLPGVAIPVILTHLLEPVWISSTISAETRFSLVKWSKDAIGRQPRVLEKKNIAAGLFDLLHNVENVGSFFPQNAVHG